MSKCFAGKMAVSFAYTGSFHKYLSINQASIMNKKSYIHFQHI